MTIDGAADPEKAGRDVTSFAEQVADVAVSFLDERDPDRLTLTAQIAAGAVAVIPGVVAAAVQTLSEAGRRQAPVMEGDSVASHLMDLQDALGEGPCVDALRSGHQVLAGDLAEEMRWREFSSQALILGVRAVLCIPLEVNGQQIGVLSLFSAEADFAGADSRDDIGVLARVFARHATAALVWARRVQDIHVALGNRDVIGQAKGILMERFKVTPDVAFAMLVRISANTNIKLRLVCDEFCQTGVLPPDPQKRPRRSRPGLHG